MKIENNKPYNFIGNFDISTIKEEVLNLTEEDWTLDITRQTVFKGVHAQTQCYFVMGFPLEWKGDGYPLERKTNKDKIYDAVKVISDQLEDHFNGRVGRAIFTKLIPRGVIPEHRDGGYYLLNSHRCHVPIITNDNIKFQLQNSLISMKAGECYEINNFDTHAVFNNSDEERIHMIIDIIPMRSFKRGR